MNQSLLTLPPGSIENDISALANRNNCSIVHAAARCNSIQLPL